MSQNPAPTLSQRLTSLWGRMRRGGATEAWNHALLNVDVRLAQALHATGVPAHTVWSHTLFQVLDHVLKNGPYRSDCLETLDHAFSSGAPLNVQHQNNSWDYLLHRASSAGDLDMVQLLVRHGADQTVLCGNKFTPLECALSGWGQISGSAKDRRAVAVFLINNGSPATLTQGRHENSILMSALDHVFDQDIPDKAQGLALIEALIDKGAPAVWNERRYEKDASYGDDDAGMGDDPRDVSAPALLEIVRCGPTTAADVSWWIGLMRQHGQGAHTQSPGGLNLLQWWMARNDQDEHALAPTFDVLRREGFDPRTRTRHGDTLWHLAVRNPSNDMDAKLALLMSCPDLGDQITTPNTAGQTPLDILQAHRTSSRFPGPEWEATFAQHIQVMRAHADHREIAAAVTDDQPDRPRRTLRM